MTAHRSPRRTTKARPAPQQIALKLKPFGPHLLIDAYCAPSKPLGSKVRFRKALSKLAKKIGMKQISPPYVDKVTARDCDPLYIGVTGTVHITKSNITGHGFPVFTHLFLDIFSCKDFDVGKVLEEVQKISNPLFMDHHLIPRATSFHACTNDL